MGTWMMVIEGTGYQDPNTRQPLVEGDPEALMRAFAVLPRAVRELFPMLRRVSKAGGDYGREEPFDPEVLVLRPAEVREVLEELRLLRQVSEGRDSLPGVDGRAIAEHWYPQFWHPDGPGAGLDAVEAVLEQGLEEGRVLLLLL
jgi:hypothetical protein